MKVFHAGTALAEDGRVVTAGGRVLGVTALGATIPEAKLAGLSRREVHPLGGAWCRKDISDKALGKG